MIEHEKSPEANNHKATQRTNNTRTTALERLAVKLTGGLGVKSILLVPNFQPMSKWCKTKYKMIVRLA